jgi:hypothetical protein
MTSIDDVRQADQILDSERARRPHWHGAARPPGWFRGRELDALDAGERQRLYLRMVAAQPGTPWTAWVLLLAWAPKGIENVVHDHHRGLWAGGAAFYVLVIAGAVLLRRRNVLTSARREVRERPDWPLRQQDRRPA